MCGKCLPPCPVDIDTAEISVLERQILSHLGYKHSPPQTKLSLYYLGNRNKLFNSAFRKTVLEWGGTAQRKASSIFNNSPKIINDLPWKPAQMLRSKMAPASETTLRDMLPPCSENETLVLHPGNEVKRTVFYFPGCGSERLYANISMASLYILLKNKIRVVLPPPFLCCGFPAKVNAKKQMHGEISLRDTIILNQIREMLGYIVFDAIVVSCGTCKEALKDIEVEEIFSCSIRDISGFTLENMDQEIGTEATSYFYHAPCHDSFDGKAPAVITKATGSTVTSIPACCSEAGTMALSRPDISGAMLQRKKIALEQGLEKESVEEILTNCPSCISGLYRNCHELNIEPKHIAEKIAQLVGGDSWQKELDILVKQTEVVTF
jgi:Fe-S oxidoreductase